MNYYKLALSLVLAGGIFGTALPGYADKGMFLFNAPPQRQVSERYGVNLDRAWLEHAMLAAVRFNNGGSGGFVSSDGLVITNHHIADEVLVMPREERKKFRQSHGYNIISKNGKFEELLKDTKKLKK